MQVVTSQMTLGRLQQLKLPKRGRKSLLPMQAAEATDPFAALAPTSQDTTASAMVATPGLSGQVPHMELAESAAENERAPPAVLARGLCPPMMGFPCPSNPWESPDVPGPTPLKDPRSICLGPKYCEGCV